MIAGLEQQGDGSLMMDLRERRLRDSWRTNAAAWTELVRSGGVASRGLGTDRAIVDAVMDRRPARVLDLGCGEGWLSRALGERGLIVMGADGSAPLIAAARAADRSLGEQCYRCLDHAALDPAQTDGRFDLVVANFALLGEDLDACLAAITRVLEPRGCLLIQTLHPLNVGPPYRDGWRQEEFSGFASDANWTAMPWYFRTLESWLAGLRAAGFTLEAVREPLHPDTEVPLSLVLEARLQPLT